MYEIHGLARLSKRQALPENTRTVFVEDGGQEVILRIVGETYSTVLTHDEAVWLSQQLLASAGRVKRAGQAAKAAAKE